MPPPLLPHAAPSLLLKFSEFPRHPPASAAPPHLFLSSSLSPPTLTKSSPRSITDQEIREKKQACYADVESFKRGRRILFTAMSANSACASTMCRICTSSTGRKR